VEEFIILHWDDDPYVPITEAKYLHDKLWGTLKIVPNGGHFNEKAGFIRFEKILEYVVA
jgi:predicted alpha/beta hydrolase family esterase